MTDILFGILAAYLIAFLIAGVLLIAGVVWFVFTMMKDEQEFDKRHNNPKPENKKV